MNSADATVRTTGLEPCLHSYSVCLCVLYSKFRLLLLSTLQWLFGEKQTAHVKVCMYVDCICVYVDLWVVLPLSLRSLWGTKQTLSEHCNPAFPRFLALGNQLKTEQRGRETERERGQRKASGRQNTEEEGRRNKRCTHY